VRGLVTGHCGPKALRVLVRAGIEVYNTDAPTVAEAIEAYRAGRLVAAEPA
jgi:predicted Fe-Mo cluster-binding NifX family protein